MKVSIFTAMIVLLVGCGIAGAQTVTTVMDNGDPANRIDLVIVGDGYTATEESKFIADVTAFFNSFFAKEFFADYRSYFNLRTVFVPSIDSGATHNERTPVVTKNTAFSSYFGCASIDRLICTDINKVFSTVSAALPANQRDYTFVIVNDVTYGGSGGTISVASINSAAVEILLHEFGHTFAQLADEYDSSPPACVLSEPTAVNATTVTVRNNIKWNYWIDNATSVPTLSTTPGTPGLYQGAQYCTSGMYRPTYNSKMRSLNQPYDQINEEQMVRKIYSFVTPLEGYAPAIQSNPLVMSDVLRFSVATTQPLQHALQISWLVDSAPITSETSTTFDFDTTQFVAGTHTIQASVRDTTSRVRLDAAHLLEDSQTWNVSVAIGTNVVSKIELQASVSDVALAQPVTFTAQVTPALGVSMPTGVVKFIDDGTVIGSGRLDASGKATLSTSSLAPGLRNVVATYYGDGNYKQLSSTAIAVNVMAPDFSVTSSSNAISIVSGQSGQLTITLNGTSTSAGQLTTFSCSNLPAYVSCTFTPGAVTLVNGNVTATMTISTSSPPPVMSGNTVGSRGSVVATAVSLTSVGLFLFGLLGAQSFSAVVRLRAMIAVIVSLLLCSCGGGSSASAGSSSAGNSASSSISSSSNSSSSSSSSSLTSSSSSASSSSSSSSSVSSVSSSSSSSNSIGTTAVGVYSITVTAASAPASGGVVSHSIPINLTVTN